MANKTKLDTKYHCIVADMQITQNDLPSQNQVLTDNAFSPKENTNSSTQELEALD